MSKDAASSSLPAPLRAIVGVLTLALRAVQLVVRRRRHAPQHSPRLAHKRGAPQVATGLIYFCMPGCAPVAGLACPDCVECDEGSGCVADYQGATLDGFICYPLAAEGTAGESCECANCCANGLMCTDAATYGPDCAYDLCCTELCDITDAAFTCAGPDQQCVALFEPTDPHFANVGACMVP